MKKIELDLSPFSLVDASFATLWWVKNTLWQLDPTFVVKEDEENNSHPGVSLKKENSSDSVIPMLQGRTEKRPRKNTVTFKMDDNSDQNTVFGTLKPVDIGFGNFFDGSVSINYKKKKLSPRDARELEAFVREKLQW